MHVNMGAMTGGSVKGEGTSKAERSQATRKALIATAQGQFAERGYAAVGTEEIVKAAGVTRGALYHHFDSKIELFAAVYEAVEEELVRVIAETADVAGKSPLEVLRTGAQAFLDACQSDPAVQRIALVDAPSVLGWERWREIGMRYGLGLVQGTVQAAIDAGQIPPQQAGPLAHLLLAAIDEGAMLIARADDAEEIRAQVGASIERILDGLGAPQAP